MKITNNKAFTLAELLITALIASLAIGAALACFSNGIYLVEMAKDNTEAVLDIRDMMEEILVTAFDTLITTFPDGDADGPTDSEYSTIVGGYTLRDQQIVVTYTSVTADPLEIMITLNWSDMRGRARSIQLAMFRTRYVSTL